MLFIGYGKHFHSNRKRSSESKKQHIDVISNICVYWKHRQYRIIPGQTTQAEIRYKKNLTPRFRLSGSLNVNGTVADRSATYDFLLFIHSNHGPISYRFRNVQINVDFSRYSHIFPVYLMPRLTEILLKFCNGGSAKRTRVIPLTDSGNSSTICVFV